jgi:methylglutaconyl-CoA hydratase
MGQALLVLVIDTSEYNHQTQVNKEMISSNFEYIRLNIDSEDVARLTLARPEKHNAFNEEVIAEITAALAQAKEAARILILQAEGKSFSAGADLDWMQRMASYDFEKNLADASGLATMLRALYSLPMPTVARVQGNAYGGGVGLIACCDVVIASEQAQFCLSEVKLGLIPATISPYVVKAVGEKVARRLFISAEVFTAAQAQAWNLVSEVVTFNELDDAVERWRKQLQKNSPAAIASAKQLVVEVTDREIDAELIQLTSRRIAEARVSKQGREGVSAFLEKRVPNWT